MNLSAIVITKNSAGKINDCLISLKFANEIVVVDSGSTDGTKELAGKSGAKLFEVESISYSHSRNLGAQKAKGEWLLYIDADEWVSSELSKEILAVIHHPSSIIHSYKIYRKNIILGQWLKHGGWWPDPVHRLIKKSTLKGWNGELLHEYPVVSGEVGLIDEPIIHFSKDSVADMVKNSRIFAPIEARLWFESGHPPVRIYHFVIAMAREFWYRGIVKAGWLDGVVGIVEVFYQMFHQMMVYSILWQMQNKKTRQACHPERAKRVEGYSEGMRQPVRPEAI